MLTRALSDRVVWEYPPNVGCRDALSLAPCCCCLQDESDEEKAVMNLPGGQDGSSDEEDDDDEDSEDLDSEASDLPDVSVSPSCDEPR